MNKCIVTPDVQIGGVFGEDPAVMSKDKQSQVTCKITGKNADWSPNHKVLTEGTVCAEFFPAGVPIMVPLGVTTNCPTGTVPISGNPTQIDPKTAGDVILLVHANTYTMTP